MTLTPSDLTPSEVNPSRATPSRATSSLPMPSDFLLHEFSDIDGYDDA